MTEGNTIPSGKNLAGAAAEVSVIVAETVGAINDYTQTAANSTVKMMNEALRSGFMGSLAGMFGGLAQAGGEVFSGTASFMQSTKKFKQAKELSALDKQTQAAITPLKAGQNEDFANISKHAEPLSGGGVLSDGKMADDRSSLEYHSSQMKSINSAAEGKRSAIESESGGFEGWTQGFQAVGRALGAMGGALGKMVNETNQSVTGVLQNGAKNTKEAADGMNSTASQLLGMAGQLYAANSMVRG